MSLHLCIIKLNPYEKTRGDRDRGFSIYIVGGQW